MVPQTPKRIQRKRSKGWKMPEGAVYVGRPTRWGNPWTVAEFKPIIANLRAAFPNRPALAASRLDHAARDVAVTCFHDAALEDRAHQEPGWYPSEDEIRAALAGHDLACWCPLDQPCHADVLLEIANGGAI